MNLYCDLCDNKLEEPGGLLFSPPSTDRWDVTKFHICVKCWEEKITKLITYLN